MRIGRTEDMNSTDTATAAPTRSGTAKLQQSGDIAYASYRNTRPRTHKAIAALDRHCRNLVHRFDRARNFTPSLAHWREPPTACSLQVAFRLGFGARRCRRTEARKKSLISKWFVPVMGKYPNRSPSSSM